MIHRLPRGLRAAALIVVVAGCSQGSSASTPSAAASTPAQVTTSAPATAAPSAAPTAAPSAAPSAAAAPGKTFTVAEVNSSGMGGAFNPPTLAIKVGDTVEWTNSSGNIHNVTFGDPAMHSPIMYGGEKWSQIFTKAGTYRYTCTFHPGMDGTIVVT